jgi:rsbT antagonist protein RsbS
MDIPILKQGNCLIASVQPALTDTGLLQLQENLLMLTSKYRSHGVIIDVTVLDVIDSFTSRTLRDTVYMLKLRGAEAVIVGIQPDMAFALVQLGITLEGVKTALDLEEGLALLER